jgi:DNA-directed RNA polymerase subunit RPC12/RpoP
VPVVALLEQAGAEIAHNGVSVDPRCQRCDARKVVQVRRSDSNVSRTPGYRTFKATGAPRSVAWWTWPIDADATG